MDLSLWAGLLFALGIVLMLGELVLPTHGLLGVLAGASVLGAVVICYLINVWLGLGVLIAAAIAAPFVGALVMRMWPRTPIGRRITLPPVKTQTEVCALSVGDVGVAVTELRPIGICEFDPGRFEAASEYGIIAAGSNVKVVAVDQNRPIVRQTNTQGKDLS